MNKLNMLLAAALLGGGAALLPVQNAHAHGSAPDLGRAVIEVQYGDAYSRGRLFVRPGAAEIGDAAVSTQATMAFRTMPCIQDRRCRCMEQIIRGPSAMPRMRHACSAGRFFGMLKAAFRISPVPGGVVDQKLVGVEHVEPITELLV